jgi:hypothetical protein
MADVNVWELEEKIRSQLASGVHFAGDGTRPPRTLAATLGLNWFVWLRLDESVPKRLTAIYIKGAVRVTVEAIVREKDVEIVSVSLDSMCGCNCGGRGYV